MPGNSYSNPYADPSNPFQDSQPLQRQPVATKQFSSSLPAAAQRGMPAIRQRTSRQMFPPPPPPHPPPWEPRTPTQARPPSTGTGQLDGNQRVYAQVITQGPNGRWYPDADTSGPGFASREEMRQAMLAKRRAAGGGVQGMPAIRTNRAIPAQPIVPASAMQDPLTPAERQFVTQQGQSQLRQFQSATDAYGNPWSSYGASGPVLNQSNGWEMYPIGHPLRGTL